MQLNPSEISELIKSRIQNLDVGAWKGKKWIGYQDPTHISLNPPSVWLEWIKDSGFSLKRVFADGFWDVPYIRFIPEKIQ